MNSYRCVARAHVDSISAAVDAAFGFPRAGVNVGPGPHAPAATAVTTRYAVARKHPTQNFWAYPRDAAVETLGIALPPGAAFQTLDTTWPPDGAP